MLECQPLNERCSGACKNGPGVSGESVYAHGPGALDACTYTAAVSYGLHDIYMYSTADTGDSDVTSAYVYKYINKIY